MELYLTAPELGAGAPRPRARSCSRLGGPETLEHLYEHHGAGALVHLFRVASSLDSMVLGEAQILGQVKDVLRAAAQGAGAVRGRAHARVRGGLRLRQARAHRDGDWPGGHVHGLGGGGSWRAKVFDELSDKTALVVGAGEMGELAARHLK